MIVSRAPMRVSLLGGGTDIPEVYERLGGGMVLSMAIDKYIYSVLHRRKDGLLRISYSGIEMVNDVHNLKHELIRELLIAYFGDNDVPGLEIHTIADIPTRGSGLGSSAALLAAVCLGLFSEFGRPKGYSTPDFRIPDFCFEVERRLGRHVGKQDHYAASYGGYNMYFFAQNGMVSVEPASANLGRRIASQSLLFNSGVERNAKKILSKYNPDANISLYSNIRSITNRYVREADGYLSRPENAIGKAVRESYEYKRRFTDDLEPPIVREMIEFAREIGAVGEKLCGAGGGGHVLVICEQFEVGVVKNAFRQKFGIEGWPFKIAWRGAVKTEMAD